MSIIPKMICVEDSLLNRIDANELFLLTHLCLRMNADHVAVCSNAELKAALNWSLDKLQKVKESLYNKGLLQRDSLYSDSGQGANSYKILTDKIGNYCAQSNIPDAGGSLLGSALRELRDLKQDVNNLLPQDFEVSKQHFEAMMNYVYEYQIHDGDQSYPRLDEINFDYTEAFLKKALIRYKVEDLTAAFCYFLNTTAWYDEHNNYTTYGAVDDFISRVDYWMFHKKMNANSHGTEKSGG